MVKADPGAPEQFHWEPQPRAQALINKLVADFLFRCPGAANLAKRMRVETGTRFLDWIDNIQLPRSMGHAQDLASVGFTRRAMPGQPECYIHEGAMFPAVSIVDSPVMRIEIKVDAVPDFLAVWKLEHTIEGEPLTQLRRAVAFRGDNAEMWVIERHGYRGFETQTPDPAKGIASLRHLEAMRRRHRDLGEDRIADARGFAHAARILDAAIADLGQDWTCDLFFSGEREYWQRRNRAGQIQKIRQDKLGLGWANHDHHTYRSSRHCFHNLIAIFEKLGFKCRERFYAGAEAGWGAQVIEQPVSGITIFADVDMSPEEVRGDFAHTPFTERPELGTVGLWCAMHGEAFLQAGMHHLECQFDWHALKDQLAIESVKTMDPFTTFPYLRQAFTEGERWPVSEKRIKAVLERGQITPQQAEQFRTQGALGSHLENLERNDGYKGFNQTGVSHIIARTDPRKQLQPA